MVPVAALDAELGSLLKELRSRDIVVTADGDQLRIDAPAGALTSELRERLVRNKPALIAFLRSVDDLAERPAAIVPLQPQGGRTPVFGVGGHNGDVFCYRALARYLGADQPFYGLQPPGLLPGTAPRETVKDLASYFADQIVAFRPSGGPCIVAGFCAGGAVAFDLAQQLLARDVEVELLALCASPYPSWFQPLSQRWVRVAEKANSVAAHLKRLATTAPKQWRRVMAARMAARRERLAAEEQRERLAATDPVLRLRRAVERATVAAVQCYVPVAYSGRACLIVPCRSWLRIGGPARPWLRVIPHAVRRFGPQGCDADTILLEPHAAHVAELFSGVIRRAPAPAAEIHEPENDFVQAQ